MIIRLFKRLLKQSDRLHYIGNTYTFITDGGWEVAGIIVEATDTEFIVNSNGRVIRLRRDKVVGSSVGAVLNLPVEQLVAPVTQGYDEGRLPLPAVARGKGPGPSTKLEQKLVQATERAEELKEELGIDDEEVFEEEERAHYGSIIPEGMLLPQGKEEEHTDLGASFDVDYRSAIRPVFDED